jgi:hypothetical protein
MMRVVLGKQHYVELRAAAALGTVTDVLNGRKRHFRRSDATFVNTALLLSSNP